MRETDLVRSSGSPNPNLICQQDRNVFSTGQSKENWHLIRARVHVMHQGICGVCRRKTLEINDFASPSAMPHKFGRLYVMAVGE
jgi:hypothetical protein